MTMESLKRFVPLTFLLVFIVARPVPADEAKSDHPRPARVGQERAGQQADHPREADRREADRREADRDRFERFRPFRDRMSDDRRPPVMRREGPGESRGPMGNPLFMALDRNGDGRIDADELDLAIASLRTLDKNNDGQITFEEAFGGGSRLGGERGDVFGRGRPGEGRPGEGRPPFSGRPNMPVGDRPAFPSGNRSAMEDMFSRMDRDGDGMLSREEAPERIADYFDRFDQDGDGKLSKHEMQAAFQRMMSMGRGDQGRRSANPEEPAGGTRPKRPESE